MNATLTRLPANEASSAIADGALRYSTVWEDHRLLERGLAIRDTTSVLMIASAGCNVLNALLRGPRRLVALDFNPAQTALLELKLAAIRTLSHADFIRLLGVRDATDRLDLFERVRPAMSTAARAWWDASLDTLVGGVETGGRLERYIAGFRERHLSRVLPVDVVDELFVIDDPAARRHHAQRKVFTPAFEAAFRDYFTSESIAGDGRDPAQFRYVQDFDVTSWFWRRLQWVATELPARGNFYLERFLRGGLRDIDAGPPYLRPCNFDRLRALAPRVVVVNEGLERYLAASPRGAFGAAALSDVFEYMSDEAAGQLFLRLAEVLRPGSRLAFWNLFVPRRPPRRVARLRSMPVLSRALWERDRSWFYRAFHVVEVLP